VVFLVGLTIGFLLGFWLDVFRTFVGSLYISLVVVFSALALGACFRLGVRPMVCTALRIRFTRWRFVAAISLADSFYFCS